MSEYLDEVRNSKDYNNYKLTADKVIEKLDGVREERTKSRRRWIWELMQNAKDVPNEYNMVSIEITISNEQFDFSHNGNPFSVGNITGLIQQVSFGKPSDSSNRRVTGKFGTGFISTHLLSDIVIVKGIVAKDPLPPKKFEIKLNRRGETSDDLIPAIKTELEKLDGIEDFESMTDYHLTRKENDKPTLFSYRLEDEESRKAAIIGVEDLANTLPQTLIFVNDQLKAVKVNDSTNEQIKIINYERIKFEVIDKLNEAESIIYATVRKQMNADYEDFNFIIFRDDEIDLAIRVSDFDDKEIIINEDSPKLFRDFPLVGSESFYFPFLLNGAKFYPTEKRDNILLEGNEKKPTANRDIIKYSIHKSEIFIEWLLKNSVKNLSSLVNIKTPKSFIEDSVKKWYEENIQIDYKQFVLNQLLVENKNIDENLSLKESIIPKIIGNEEENKKFWDIVCDFYGQDKICKKEHLHSWHEYIGTSGVNSSWGCEVFYTLENLLEEIHRSEKINVISLKGEIKIIDWLNNLYTFIIDIKQTELFNDYKIIPTISGILKSYKDELFIEEKGKAIPDHFITIYKNLKTNWDDILIHRDIIKMDNTRTPKTIKDISDEINKVLNGEEKNSSGQVQKSFYEKENAENYLLEILRVFSNENSNSFRTNIFKSAKIFLNYGETEKIIANIEEFNFSPAIRQLIKLLNTKIENINSSLDSIERENSLKWLKTYLILIQNNTEFKNLLEFGNIVPNRKKELCAFEDIKGYGTQETPLDDTLIEILFDLNSSEDWDKILIHDSFRELPLESKKFDELAFKMQTQIDKLRIENEFSSRRKSILGLIHWCSKHPIKAQNYFKAFLQQKDSIFVNISLEDKDVGNNIVKLLSDKEKLNNLVSISESGLDLSKLSQILEMVKSSELDLEDIEEHVKQLKEDKDDFEFKKNIGTIVENIFMNAFESLGLSYNAIYQGIGSQDVIISNSENGKLFFIELKSLSPTTSDKSIKLYVKQAEKAVQQLEEGNYVVSVLVRPIDNEETSIEFIKQNLNSVLNIGTLLKEVINKNSQLEKLLTKTSPIYINFESEKKKIIVSENIWTENGESFEKLIEKIKNYLG